MAALRASGRCLWPATAMTLILALAAVTLASAAAAQGQRRPAPAALTSLMADSVAVDGRGRLVASGAVEIWHGSVRLTATRVIFTPGTGGAPGQLQIDGPMALSDGPDRLFLADQSQLSGDLREGLMQGARLVLHEQLQIAAERVERQDGRRTRLDAAVASTCEVCAARPTPLWEIRAARITHDEETRSLHFEQAQFHLRGVPVAYLPRLRLPDGSVDRAPGLLRPEVDASSELGLRFGLPFFIPFGPDRDLTLTPQLGYRSMVGLGLRWRQATRAGGIELGGQVNRDRLTDDRWRGYAYLRALFALPQDFRLEIDAILPSDRAYLDTYDITDSTRLRSHLTVERIRRDQALRARAVSFQSLRPDDDNRTLPGRVLQADWDQRWLPPGLGGEAVLQARLHGHQRPSSRPGDAGRDVARAALTGRWSRQAILAGGILGRIAVQGRVDHVRIGQDPGFAGPVTRRAAEAMVELRWPWVAVDRAGGQQLIEPVAQIIGARRDLVTLPNEDHLMPELDAGNLFSPLRYSGLDAPDDGSRANLGLRWMRHAPQGWQTEALIGRVWRRTALEGFDPDHRQPLGVMRSDWLLAGRIQSPQGLQLGLRLLMDDSHRVSRGEASAIWLRDRGTSITSRYLYVVANAAENRMRALNEVSMDLNHRFESGWRGRVGWDYDIGTGAFSRARGGLEFRNECLAVDLSVSHRFVTAANLTASTRLNLRMELLGLSGRSPEGTGRACRS